MGSTRDRLEEFYDKVKEYGTQIEEPSPKKLNRKDRLRNRKERKKQAKIDELKRQRHQLTEDFLLQATVIKKQIVKLKKLINEIRIQQGKTFIVPHLDDNEMMKLESKCTEVYKQCSVIKQQIKELEGSVKATSGARHKICCLQCEFLINQLKTVMDDFRLMQTGYVEKRKRDYREQWIMQGTKSSDVSDENKNIAVMVSDNDQCKSTKKNKFKLTKKLSFSRSKNNSDQSLADKSPRKTSLHDIDENEQNVENVQSESKKRDVEVKEKKSSIRKRLSMKRDSIIDYFDEGKRNSISKEKSDPNLSGNSESSDDDIDSAFDRYSKSYSDSDLLEDEPVETDTLKRDKTRWSMRFGFKKMKFKTPEQPLSQTLEQVERKGSDKDSVHGDESIATNASVSERAIDVPQLDSNDQATNRKGSTSEVTYSEFDQATNRKGSTSEVTYSEFENSIDIDDSSTPNKNWSKKEKMKIPLLSSLRRNKAKRKSKELVTAGDGKQQANMTAGDGKQLENVNVKSDVSKLTDNKTDKGRQSDSSQVSNVELLTQGNVSVEEGVTSEVNEVEEFADVFEEEDVPNKSWSRKEKMKISLLSSLRKPKSKKSEKENKSGVKTSNDNGQQYSPGVNSLQETKALLHSTDIQSSECVEKNGDGLTCHLMVSKSVKPLNGLSGCTAKVVIAQVETKTGLGKGGNSTAVSQENINKEQDGASRFQMPLKNRTIFTNRFISKKKRQSFGDDNEDESKMIPLLEHNSESSLNSSDKPIEKVPDVVFGNTQVQNPHNASVTMEAETVFSKEVLIKGDNSNDDNELLVEIETEKSRKELEIIQKREQRLKILENNIKDMTELQTEMYSIVEQGGDQLNRIEHFIDTAEYNIEVGIENVKEARKWSDRLRKRKVILCIVAGSIILIAVVIILIVSLA